MHRRRRARRLSASAVAKAEARLLALLAPGAAPKPSGWTPPPDTVSPPPRVDPGRPGALAMVAVAALVVALVGIQAWRHRPRAAEPPQPPVAMATSDALTGRVVVDVEGEVRRPGLVTLRRGARVAEALRAAGGVRPGASTASVNLARLVVDGEQIVVGGPGTTAAGTTPGGGQLLDLNTATVEQLDALPGVGPVLAQRIVDWRTAHGGFRDLSQLREVAGIGERKYGDLAKRVRT